MTTLDFMSEARFTSARPDCPHPERWHSSDPESAELEVSEFIGALVRLLQPDLVIETGSGFGQTTLHIAEAIAQNGHGRMLTFETDRQRWARVHAAVRAHGYRRVAVCNNDVTSIGDADAHEGNRDERTFAFLDSDPQFRAHEYRWLRERGILRDGDMVAVHDAGPQHVVSREFRPFIDNDDVFGNLRLDAIYLPTPRGLLLGECR